MANPDRPSGFRPVGTLSGAPWQGLVRRGVMGSGGGTDVWDNIYIGDPVKFDVAAAAGNSNPYSIIPCFLGQSDCIGVCVGVGYIPAGQPANEAGMFNAADLEKRYGDASAVTTAAAQVYIYYVPTSDVIFEAQTASALSTNAIGEQLGHNCTEGSGTHGSVTTSLSSVEIVADPGTSDVVVVGIPEYPDNDSAAANARLHVMFVDRGFHAVTPDLT